MEQDFENRIAIVINKSLQNWQVLNAIAHISANYGHYLGQKFCTGESFPTSDGLNVPRNTQYPIIIFEANPVALQIFALEVNDNKSIKPMYFIREMIETSNDIEIERIVATKRFEDIEFLGVGIFGENSVVKSLTKKFELWS